MAETDKLEFGKGDTAPMKANAISLLNIFEKKMRLEVPLFQRQYVWNLEKHWDPLWEDIARKYSEYLMGRKDVPVHFLGAMVFDQKQTPTTHVEKRQVIDGQQRLTTLQIFLAAFRDFCREKKVDDLAKELDSFTSNKGMMAEPDVDQFKVWPTQADRAQFRDVLESQSVQELVKRHPLVRRKYARKPEPRPRMVEAYLFFYRAIANYFMGNNSEPPIAGEAEISARLEECFQAMKNSLQVVVIDLEKDDDPQVIFETLNARGEPLLPADLLRNYIFLRAARHGESQEKLYEVYWKKFDEPFWREVIRQGRLFRPRSDLFMQHFLASRRMIDIPITHLFVEYKDWIEKEKPFLSVRDELAVLAKNGDAFRKIILPKEGDDLFPLTSFLRDYDIGTAYPLLLFLQDAGLSDADWKAVSEILESYLVRRAVCGMTTKNYNRIFLTLTRFLREEGPTPENIRKYLSELTGESSGWPRDEAFGTAWQTQHAYQALNHAKIVYIFRRLNDTYMNRKSEPLRIDGPLTVEHILPRYWLEKWPLPDGSKGLNSQELWGSGPDDPIAVATRRRNALLQTFGNLTILTQELNSAVSNGSWSFKKPELLRSSLLPINQQLHDAATWEEDAIERRSGELFSRAVKIWPAPIDESKGSSA